MNPYKDLIDQVVAANVSSMALFDLELLQENILTVCSSCPPKYFRRLELCLHIVNIEILTREKRRKQRAAFHGITV